MNWLRKADENFDAERFLSEHKQQVVENAKNTPFENFRNMNWYETFLDAVMYGLKEVRFTTEAALKQYQDLLQQGRYDEIPSIKGEKVYSLTGDKTTPLSEFIAQIDDPKIREAIEKKGGI